jgi:hypothetical protein
VQQDRQCTYHVTSRRVLVTIVVVQKQCALHILSVSVAFVIQHTKRISLLWSRLWPVWLCHIFPHYAVKVTIKTFFWFLFLCQVIVQRTYTCVLLTFSLHLANCLALLSLYVNTLNWLEQYRYTKVKQSHYRPWQVLRVPEGWGSQILRQSAHEGGKVVSPTHRSPLTPGNIPGTHFCYTLNQPQGHSAAGRIVSMKNPVTPSGIELVTFRFVAQCLNHYASTCPVSLHNNKQKRRGCSRIYWCIQDLP